MAPCRAKGLQKIKYMGILKKSQGRDLPGTTVKKVKIEITGMTCDHCAASIEKLVERKKGIIAARVSYETGRGEFTFNRRDISEKEIVAAINSTKNYRVKSITHSGEEGKATATRFDLIIIGGGSAAFSAAIHANELGLSTLMVNGGLPIGGTCVNVGCLPSKHLIRAAESIHKASHSPFDGIQPNKPGWDYDKILHQKKELVKGMQQKKYQDVVKTFSHLSMVEGWAKFTDPHAIRLNDGKEFTADKFIIATGSKTSVPPVEGLREIGYLTNETLFDLESLPESITIIGGGYIGLEIAQAYRRFGSKVRIIEYYNRILPTQSKDIAGELAKYFTEEGIEIITGVRLAKAVQQGNHVVLQGMQNEQLVEFVENGKVVIAAGREPNTSTLGLDKARVDTLASGHIKVNKFLETNVPGIYAVGDCNPNPPFVYTAAYEGKIAVQNAFEGLNRKADYTGMPWVIFTDPQVAGVGMDEHQAEKQGLPYEISKLPLQEVPRAASALDTRGFIKLIRNPETDQLLGARIVAPEGGELVMEVSLAIKYGISVTELAESFHPYLTLSEGIKLAAVTFKKDIAELSCCAT